ncbi:MAG: PH domain-containing protein [Patescibacteria group bacterium]
MYSATKIPNQQPDEQVISFLRRHWIEPFKIASIFFTLLILLVALDYGLYAYTGVWESEWGYPLMALGNSAFVLFVLLFAFSNFVDYYLDTWIVTNKRIINVEQRGLFSRVVSEKELNRMQDVTSEVHGAIATFLNYGDVIIQTAGEEQRFRFKQVPNAAAVAQQIGNLVTSVRETRPFPMYIANKENGEAVDNEP